jgi:hypothetical protein
MGMVPWPEPVPAPGASKVMILFSDCGLACGHAAKAKHVQKTNSRILMRFMFPSMKENSGRTA